MMDLDDDDKDYWGPSLECSTDAAPLAINVAVLTKGGKEAEESSMSNVEQGGNLVSSSHRPLERPIAHLPPNDRWM
jgi:hypothetical protein